MLYSKTKTNLDKLLYISENKNLNQSQNPFKFLDKVTNKHLYTPHLVTYEAEYYFLNIHTCIGI